jgi:hypothetical protein
MTMLDGLGMLLLGVIAISIAAVITYFIINR